MAGAKNRVKAAMRAKMCALILAKFFGIVLKISILTILLVVLLSMNLTKCNAILDDLHRKGKSKTQ